MCHVIHPEDLTGDRSGDIPSVSPVFDQNGDDDPGGVKGPKADKP